jgi:hypothetical protein
MTDMTKAALAYTQPNGERTPWAIFPLTQGAKIPLPGGHGCTEATADAAKVAEWWKKTPAANIGIACGEINGFIVVDVDRGHDNGIDGADTLRELEQEMGALPDTVEALTPNGGRHLFFKYPDGQNIRNKTGIAPGIDIRANGGYVVGVPSTLANGRSYEWEASSYPNEHEIAALPDAWRKWLIDACGRFSLPQETRQGGRNDTLHRYGASLRAQGYPPERIRELLAKYNRESCRPPVDDRELETILSSVLRYPAGTPVKQTDAPQAATQAPKRARLTRAALADEMHARGYSVRYNVISGEYETIGRTEAGRVMTQDDLITLMHDALADDYKGASFDTLTQYIAFQARENQYNPVVELLKATKWDGVDRLPQLYNLVGVNDDALSKTLIRKWLYQAVALLFNDAADPFGADGCLVLNGEQGAGKTSLFRHLALRDAWFGEGCSIDDHDKDTGRRVITKWISELGEVESTLKSDISKLKAFVSASVDRYRLPYGKSDVVAPRFTSLCATCNSDRYLIDPTGNRRWWSVPFNRTVPRAELLELDALQLWAQIFAIVAPLNYHDKAACFRLSEDEKKLLAVRNGEYEKPLKSQPEVADILFQAKRDDLTMKRMTVSEFKSMWDVLRPYTAQQISAALKACEIEITRTRAGAVAELPTPFHAGNSFGK